MNHGNKNAGMMIQRTLNKLGLLSSSEIDGVVGPKTRKALSMADPDEFATEILNVRENFYHKIVQNKPSQKVFIRGWINRVNDLRKIIKTF